jgi:hypothetical protein
LIPGPAVARGTWWCKGVQLLAFNHIPAEGFHKLFAHLRDPKLILRLIYSVDRSQNVTYFLPTPIHRFRAIGSAYPIPEASSPVEYRLTQNSMKIFSKFNRSSREPVPKRNSTIGQWTLSLLQGQIPLPRSFLITLPYEVWEIILWIVLDSVIDPLSYCNSDTYPALYSQFRKKRHGNFQDWSNFRLVCRLWYNIVGSCPHIMCSPRKPLPEGNKLVRIMSLNYIIYGKHGERVIDLRHYPQLTNQITHIAFSFYTIWSDNKHIHEYVEFPNVKSLVIGWIDPLAEHPNFWSGFNAAFPQLTLLSVRGDLNGPSQMVLPHIEMLTIDLNLSYRIEPDYDLPRLKHFSASSWALPVQLFRQYGPSLHSLLLSNTETPRDIDRRFWRRFSSLRTIGINPDSKRSLVGPPPDHPLSHLCLFLSASRTGRVDRIRYAVDMFPSICKLSVEIPDITTQEKDAVTQIAKRSSLELHFLVLP